MLPFSKAQHSNFYVYNYVYLKSFHWIAANCPMYIFSVYRSPHFQESVDVEEMGFLVVL